MHLLSKTKSASNYTQQKLKSTTRNYCFLILAMRKNVIDSLYQKPIKITSMTEPKPTQITTLRGNFINMLKKGQLHNQSRQDNQGQSILCVI